jgi:hypothetical protein
MSDGEPGATPSLIGLKSEILNGQEILMGGTLTKSPASSGNRGDRVASWRRAEADRKTPERLAGIVVGPQVREMHVEAGPHRDGQFRIGVQPQSQIHRVICAQSAPRHGKVEKNGMRKRDRVDVGTSSLDVLLQNPIV